MESVKNEAVGKGQEQAENGAKAEVEAAQNGVPRILENGAIETLTLLRKQICGDLAIVHYLQLKKWLQKVGWLSQEKRSVLLLIAAVLKKESRLVWKREQVAALGGGGLALLKTAALASRALHLPSFELGRNLIGNSAKHSRHSEWEQHC